MWDVLDILAQRTDVRGNSEVLVVWKPSWIPTENLVDGSVSRNWLQLPKCRFMSAAGNVILPVEDRSPLADDLALIAAEAEAQIAHYRAGFTGTSGCSVSGAAALHERERITPRKVVAKKTRPPKKTK
jgi:hypothetical protein